LRVAIHQPDVFPWLGFFHKVGSVDTFILFDHIQVPRGRHWTTRNRILLNGEVSWLTVPIRKRGRGLQVYRDIEINYDQAFQRKHLGTLEQAYRRAPAFGVIFPEIERLYAARYEKLVDFNNDFITGVTEHLGARTAFVSSSTLIERRPDLKDLTGNELLLELCVTAGAESYISGEGCTDFIRPESFVERGIRFFFQRFEPIAYPQSSREFVSHLSILDALFNLGYEATRDIISKEMIEEI